VLQIHIDTIPFMSMQTGSKSIAYDRDSV